MARLILTTWLWGEKYGGAYVRRLHQALQRHMTDDWEWMLCRPPPEDEHLTRIPGCFARLRMFDPEWQARNGIEAGDRLVCLDLDLIVTGSLGGLFDRPEPFVILQGVNASNPCPYNGSLWMMTAGHRPDVWRDFSLEAAAKVPHDKFPDDQAWFAHKLRDAGAFGPEQGVYAFHKPGWPKGEALPKNARIVAFPGWRDPEGFKHIPWVKQHWLSEGAAA